MDLAFENNLIKLKIEEDEVGFYLIVYFDVGSNSSNKDYLFDSLEEAFAFANEEFGVDKTQWKMVKEK